MHDFNGMGWGMGYGWLIGLFVFGAVIWIINRLVNPNLKSSALPQKSALDILKERYAKGEIGKEVFEEMKRTLNE